MPGNRTRSFQNHYETIKSQMTLLSRAKCYWSCFSREDDKRMKKKKPIKCVQFFDKAINKRTSFLVKKIQIPLPSQCAVPEPYFRNDM